MSGCCAGVQTRVREFAPYAVYIHCYAYILNVFVSSSKVHVLFLEKQRQI